MGLVQVPPKAWRGGGGLEVQLVEWKIKKCLLNLGSMACREGRLSVTGRVVVTMTELRPPGLGAAPEKDGANRHQRSVKTDEKKRARAVLPKLCLVISSVPFQALPGWFRIGFGLV